MYAHLIALLIFAAVPAAAQSEAWKTEVDNSLVRVARRVVAPRETIAVSDSAPALFVFLTEYPVRITTAARQEELRGKRGQCFWYSGGKISLENPSEQLVEVARVVPKFSPDPSYELPPANPQRVEFENGLMRMRHPGSGAGRLPGGRLEHPAASVLIEFSAGHFRLTHTSGRVEEVRVKGGEIWFQPEDPFYIENPGRSEGLHHEALRIELKTREAKP